MRVLTGIVMLGLAVAVTACAEDAGTPDEETEVGAFVLERDAAQEEVPVVALDEGPEPITSAAGAPPGAVDLADGFLSGGLGWGVEEGEWVETSSQVLDREVPFVAADLAGSLSPEATSRPARCRVSLRAPEDRGLTARGQLAVDLVVTDPDGGEVRLPSHRVALDLGLGPGERIEGPAGEPRTVVSDEVSGVRCTASFVPG